MSNENIKLNYFQARSNIFAGTMMRRESWAECRKVRKWEQSDAEYVGYFPDMIVEDCPKKCDCQIGPFIPTSEDENGIDWIIVEADQKI